MKNKVTVTLALLSVLLGTGIVRCAISGHRAKVVCDKQVSADLTHFNTRMTFRPDRLIASPMPIGNEWGWVVGYSNRSGNSGVSFFVTWSGKIIASGLPLELPDVVVRQDEVTKFIKKMSAADQQIYTGMPYSEVPALLGEPLYVGTNGNVIIYSFTFSCPAGWLGNNITNGYTVAVENDIVIRKFPITTTRY